ncbi:Fe-S cluster assembly ATPase SufC [Candidatus Saccharibacteria bacterium]|nr:Fe-S cluster assembly ATPase SufC [Candidatus Saccharibacteria bacterium]
MSKRGSSLVGGALLKVEDLHVATDVKEILHGVSVEVLPGETAVLLGPNGAGKSSLASAVMGLPGLSVTGGKIEFDGAEITGEAIDERARREIFMAWQTPVEIPGVSFRELLLTTGECSGPRGGYDRAGAREPRNDGRERRVPEHRWASATKALELSPFMLQREVNVGLSGGEKKKLEILQMMALSPRLAILDETDSGLDVDAAKTVSKAIRDYQKETGLALLIVTHNARILQSLKVDKVYVLADGRVAKVGDGELIKKIEKEGFRGVQLLQMDGEENE